MTHTDTALSSSLPLSNPGDVINNRFNVRTVNRTLGNDRRQKTLFVSGRRLEVGLFAEFALTGEGKDEGGIYYS